MDACMADEEEDQEAGEAVARAGFRHAVRYQNVTETTARSIHALPNAASTYVCLRFNIQSLV